MPLAKRCDTLLVDLNSVLLGQPMETHIVIDPKLLRKMVNTEIWYDHEAGLICEEVAYAELAVSFGVERARIKAAISILANASCPRTEMLDLIHSFKLGGRKIYGICTMSKSAWSTLKTREEKAFEIFDGILLSSDTGYRAPEQGFYESVLLQTGSKPCRTILLNSVRENLVTAQSMGMKTIFDNNIHNVERSLYNLFEDPLARATDYMKRNAKRHLSCTASGQIIHENFSQLLILEATNDPSLVDYAVFAEEWNFFKGPGEFTDFEYPNDLDTTSIAWTVTPHVADHATKMRVMDRMLTFCDRDGIPLTYFDSNRPRRDHAICVNVLTLFYTYGRGEDLHKAVDWIQSVLQTRAYAEGSRYYMGPEPFLYFLLRLLETSLSLMSLIGPLYEERCQEHMGSAGGALALAMRLHCCTRVRIKNSVDYQRLLEMQQKDGGWDAGIFYKFSNIDVQFGNRGLATAIALRAIQEYDKAFM